MDLPEPHVCLLTPLSINVATQPQPGSATSFTALFLGPAHPRNAVLAADLRSAASLPANITHRSHQVAAEPSESASGGVKKIDFEALASIQGLLDAVRFVREKYARSSLCVHLLTDSDVAVQAWNQWIPLWEGIKTTAPLADMSSASTSRGWPQLPNRSEGPGPDPASSRGLVGSYEAQGGSAYSSTDVTETASMFTALSSFSLHHREGTDSAGVSPRSGPIDLEPVPAVSLDPSVFRTSRSAAAAAHSTSAQRATAISGATELPPTAARIPRLLTASTYSAAYPLLRALAVLHRLFAHDDEDAFNRDHKWNGRVRLTVALLPQGRINAASELLQEEMKRITLSRSRRNSSAVTATRNTPTSDSRRSSNAQQPFTVTTVSWRRTPSEAEKQEEAERVRAQVAIRIAIQREIELKEAASRRQAGSRLHSVPSLFWKRRPSNSGPGSAGGETVDAIFERSQFALPSASGDAHSLSSRTKSRSARRLSLSSATLLASAREGSSATSGSDRDQPTSLISPPRTNPASPEVSALASGAGPHSMTFSPPFSDREGSSEGKLLPRPPSPGDRLNGPLRRKPVPDLLPALSSGTGGLGGTEELASAFQSDSEEQLAETTPFAGGKTDRARPQMKRSVSGSAFVESGLLPTLDPATQSSQTPGVSATAPTTPTARILTSTELAPVAPAGAGALRDYGSPHRRAISAGIDFLPRASQEISPRKRASTQTKDGNSIVFPSGGNSAVSAAVGSGDPVAYKQAWRWADPNHRNATQHALPSPSATEVETVKTIATGPSNVWPAWRWATGPPTTIEALVSGASHTASHAHELQMSPAFGGAVPHSTAAVCARLANESAAGHALLTLSSRPSSRASPSPRPPSVTEAAYRARITERFDANSRAASPFTTDTPVPLSASRRETPSPLFYDIGARSRTRASSIISSGSNGVPVGSNAAAWPSAPPSTGSSAGRSGLTGNWKWSNESQNRLERQKARAEELAASRFTGSQGAAAPITEQSLTSLPAGTGVAAGTWQLSMGSRRSSASGGNVPSSSLFSSSPYGSATDGGLGTHTAFTISAANSSRAPSPRDPPTLNLHEAYGLQTTAQLRTHRARAMKRQRSTPKLYDVPDTSALGHGAFEDEDEAAGPIREEYRDPTEHEVYPAPDAAREEHDDIDEQGSPLSAADLALERQLATAAWTASIAPLVHDLPDEPPHQLDRMQTAAGLPGVGRSTARGAAHRGGATPVQHADEAPSRVARSGTRSRILSSLKRPPFPLAESSTALGSKLSTRLDA